jgi:predicted metal-dependent peptidase
VVRENLNIIVAIDCSMSISVDEYNKFISEVCGLCASFPQIDARILFWSTEVDEDNDIVITNNTYYELRNKIPHSTGGTTFSCVARYLQKRGHNVDVIIVLTDGYIEKDPEVDTCTHLFILVPDGMDTICKKYGSCCKLIG